MCGMCVSEVGKCWQASVGQLRSALSAQREQRVGGLCATTCVSCDAGAGVIIEDRWRLAGESSHECSVVTRVL